MGRRLCSVKALYPAQSAGLISYKRFMETAAQGPPFFIPANNLRLEQRVELGFQYAVNLLRVSGSP